MTPELLPKAAEQTLVSRPIKLNNKIDSRKMLHELQVHQIELEMQNEELQKARITEKKLSQTYIELFELAPVGYFVIEPSGFINYVNLRGASLLGVDRFDLVGQMFLNYVTAQHKVIFQRFLRAIFTGEDKQNCEIEVQVSSDILWFRVAANIGATATNCLTSMVDITRSKQAEQALVSSENFTEAVINASASSMCVLNEDGYIVKVNHAWKAFYDGNT